MTDEVTSLYITRHDHYGLGTGKKPNANLDDRFLGPKVILYDMWRAQGWDILTHGGFITYFHHNASGLLTFVFHCLGCKIWAYAHVKKNLLLRNGMISSNYLKTCWRNQTIQALQLLWELFWSKRVIYCEFEAHLLINKYWYLSIKVATPRCMAQRIYTCKGHDIWRTLPYVWCTPFDRTESILRQFKRLRRSEEGGICDKRIPRSR